MMMNDDLRQNLVQWLQDLLNSNDRANDKAICRQIYQALIDEFQFDFSQSKSTKTHFGKALDPRSTAMTLLLPIRNKRFLQAVVKALDEKKKILYLGTGLFAPFCLFPLLLGYKAQFTLIDIDEYCLGILDRVIQRFQLSDHIEEVIQADAATWKVNQSYDLVIGAVNDIGMRYEDSFEIHKNILLQLPKAQFIPNDILLYLEKEDEITAYDSLLQGIKRGQLRTDCPYPKEAKPILQTKVEVDEDLTLEPGESEITQPIYFYS